MQRFFFGHHRCGTTWIRDVIRKICRKSGSRYYVVGGSSAGFRNRWYHRDRFDCYVNATPGDLAAMPAKARGFHVVRDPRDVLISDYWSRLKSHQASEDWKIRLREELEALSLEEGLVHMLDRATYFEQIRDWPGETPDNLLTLRYEDLLADEQARFREIHDHLQLKLTRDELVEIVRSCSFETVTGRSKGAEQVDAHRRKATAGDWRNYLKPGTELYKTVRSRIGGLVTKLGYDWDYRTDNGPDTNAR
jgi:hypothetical protein